jgi:hypothetical protein
MTPDKEFELLTQEIYQILLKAQGLTTIEVKNNVKIKGKAFEHQIDVYWEYEIADIKHRVAIECKHYNSEVSVGRVRDFYGVLSDIGNINGIMVSKIGFQKGAKEYASYYGINLKELRPPSEDDWKGRIKSIIVNIRTVVPNIKQRNIVIDQDWVKANIELPTDSNFSYSIRGMADEIWIFDKEGNKIKNFNNLDQELPIKWKSENDIRHNYEFEDAYIEVEKYGKIKIKGIQYLYNVNTGIDEIRIDGQDTAKAILKDVLTGKILFFDKNGNVK